MSPTLEWMNYPTAILTRDFTPDKCDERNWPDHHFLPPPLHPDSAYSTCAIKMGAGILQVDPVGTAIAIEIGGAAQRSRVRNVREPVVAAGAHRGAALAWLERGRGKGYETWPSA